MSRRPVIVATCFPLLVGALALYFFVLPDSTEPPAANSSTTARSATAPHSLPELARHRATTVDAAVDLPPAHLSFGEAESRLLQEAERGSSEAACRLAEGYIHCRDYWRSKERLEILSRRVEGTPVPLRSSADLQNQRAYLSVIRAREFQCRGSSNPQAQSVAMWLRRAAVAGNRFAARRFIAGAGFDLKRLSGLSDELDAYRRLAPGLAWDRAKAGDVDALMMLADAYSPLVGTDYHWLGQVVQKDRAMALALYRQVDRALYVSGYRPDEIAARLEHLEGRLSALERRSSLTEIARSRELLDAWGPPPAGDARALSRERSTEANALCDAKAS